MSEAEEKLQEIADELKNGIAPQRERVRAFLYWFGWERRGYRVVGHIRSTLKRFGLVTVPDFEYAYIDGYIGFELAPADVDARLVAASGATDPTYRISRLEAANRLPLSVSPDSTLRHAVTLMLTHDFSQLPVMTGPRDLKGAISWKTIGSRLALKRPCDFVRECMEAAPVLKSDESLFAAVSSVASNDYVLIQASDKTICGIVTASDLSDQFGRLAEPFLLVGEIENGIRRLLHGKFTAADLNEAKAPGDETREVAGIADLTFGEYLALIENETRWAKLRLEVDRVEFVGRLNKVREIRNDVMHFDPDGLEPSDLELLRDFARFLRRLRDVGAM